MQQEASGIFAFKPGLAGGHCRWILIILLTRQKIGYKPKVILAGREINDNMGNHAVSEFEKELKKY